CQGRRALAFLPAGAAQRYAVVERAVVADFGGLADHHAHAMVDEEAPADAGAGMDLDTGEPARDCGKEARRPAQAMPPQPMVDAMHQQRVQAGIAGEHLERVAGGGVALHHATDLFFEPGQHMNLSLKLGGSETREMEPATATAAGS